MKRLRVIFRNLTRSEDLRVENLKAIVIAQLKQQGRVGPDHYRYKVIVNILPGGQAPARDLDNYEKPLSDAITASRLLWKDDDQKERMRVERVKYRSGRDSRVVMLIERCRGQHGGVPSFFRALCASASRGGKSTYADAGYHLALHLAAQSPFDLDDKSWRREIRRFIRMLDNADDRNAWIWLRGHLPRWMQCVPISRRHALLTGIRSAHENGRLEW